jgi:hypothetical protein
MLINKTKILLTIALLSLGFLWSGEVQAAVIFQDDFDNPTESTTCNDGIREGYTTDSACDSNTYGGVTRYCAEISSGGRVGNSLKFWRRNGVWGNNGWSTPSYCGGWGKYFTTTEFNNHYKELFVRWYVKIPPEWDASLAMGETHKLNRFYIGTSAGSVSSQILVDVNGATFKNGRIAWALPHGPVYYTVKTISQMGINDGQWHSIEWQIRLNSTTGSTDGGIRIFINGVEEQIYNGNFTDPRYGVWGINMGVSTNEYFTTTLPPALGNLTDGTWNFPTNGWYAIEFDDYVVSTSYIGPESKEPPPSDTNPPSVSFTTNSPQNISSNSLAISGTASDNVGVTECKWRIGTAPNTLNGTALSGTTAWSGTASGFSEGANTLYVGCRDAAGNWGSKSIIVNYASEEPPPVQPETILFETWESGNDLNWRCDYIQGDSRVNTNPPVYEGSYSFKQHSSSAGNYVHCFADNSLLGSSAGNQVSDITVEEYYYLPSGFQWSTGQKLWLMNSFERWGAGYTLAEGRSKPHSWAPYYMTISADSLGRLYGELTRADGLGGTGELWGYYPQNQGNPVSLQMGQWNKIRFRLKMNTPGQADGIFQLWINDVLKSNYSNMNFRGTYTDKGWNHLMMSMHGDSSAPSQWIARDNIRLISNYASALLGDLNNDGIVNIFDYNIFLQHFGVVEDCQNEADLNGDCSVNIFDYNILLENFGRTQ